MSIADRVHALLFPPKCAVCHRLLDWYDAARSGQALCQKCLDRWEKERRECCGICRRPVDVCDCLTEELKHTRVTELYKLVYYRNGTIDAVPNRVIYQIKRRRDTRTAAWLASQMRAHLDRVLAACADEEVVLTYVPRGRRARLEYGTDQAEELVKVLSRLTGIPMLRLIQRVARQDRAQKMLSADERIRQAKANYRLLPDAKERLEGRSVVIVDDIVTTGATLAACARLLRTAGAKRILCLVVASDDANRDQGILARSKK